MKNGFIANFGRNSICCSSCNESTYLLFGEQHTKSVSGGEVEEETSLLFSGYSYVNMKKIKQKRRKMMKKQKRDVERENAK